MKRIQKLTCAALVTTSVFLISGNLKASAATLVFSGHVGIRGDGPLEDGTLGVTFKGYLPPNVEDKVSRFKSGTTDSNGNFRLEVPDLPLERYVWDSATIIVLGTTTTRIGTFTGDLVNEVNGSATGSGNFTVEPVPESPSVLGLLVLAALGTGSYVSKKQKVDKAFG